MTLSCGRVTIRLDEIRAIWTNSPGLKYNKIFRILFILLQINRTSTLLHSHVIIFNVCITQAHLQVVVSV